MCYFESSHNLLLAFTFLVQMHSNLTILVKCGCFRCGWKKQASMVGVLVVPGLKVIIIYYSELETSLSYIVF